MRSRARARLTLPFRCLQFVLLLLLRSLPMTRLWLLLCSLLIPMTVASGQRATYPRECTLTYIAKATTPDSTKARCIADRARVDLYNATITYNKADSVAQASLLKLTQAKITDSLARAAYATVMEKYKPSTGPVASVVLIHSNGDKVAVGSALQLFAEVKDAAGTVISRPVSWSGSSLAVADVSGIGLLTGKSAGTVVVSAKADAIIGQRTYTVTGTSPPPVDSTPPKPDTTTPPPTATGIAPHPYPAPANGAKLAELPREVVSTTVPPPTRTINVISLVAAYDTARTGDRLLIPRNHTTSNAHFKATARASWVTIQGTDSTSVITGTVGGAESSVNIEPRAHHIRFLGPLTITQSIPMMNALARSYNGETTVADVPHDIIFDDVTIKVPLGSEARRCIWPDGARMAVVNSRLLGCATKSGDAQAAFIANGPGPYLFANNYMEGGHQCFMSGGGDPSIPGSIPSDVWFHHNTCVKPLFWHYAGTAPNQTYPGNSRQVKTGIETKNILRALFEYNTVRNVWADAQVGFCWLLKSGNQDFTAPWSQSVDITARYNRCVNVASGMNLAAQQQGAVPMARVTAYDNWFDSLSTAGGEGIPLQILDNVSDVIFTHNTFTSSRNNGVSFDGLPGVRTVIYGNLIPHGDFGVKGSGSSDGMPTITRWMPGGIFQWNIIAQAPDCALYPTTNLCTVPVPLPVTPDGKPIGADRTKVP